MNPKDHLFGSGKEEVHVTKEIADDLATKDARERRSRENQAGVGHIEAPDLGSIFLDRFHKGAIDSMAVTLLNMSQ